MHIINEGIKPGESLNNINMNTTTENPILRKTIKNLGDGRTLETIEIMTEEVIPEQKRRVQEDIASILKRKKSIKFANTTPISKIKHEDKGEDDDDYIDENRPDSEFLKKVRKYSTRKLSFGNPLRKMKSEEIKKSLINEIDSTDKNKDKKSNKNILKISKKTT